MSESTSIDNMSNVDATLTDEQPRKYVRRNNDISIGVTTRSRQREQEKQNKKTESSETMSTNQSLAATLPKVSTLEQCAICMENLITQQVGIPENCEHSFCLPCIIEWSKKNNSCPIDRIVFRRIFKKRSFTSPKPYESMEVEDNRLQVQLEDDFLEMIDDDISCRVCGRDDQEALLLICDECGNGYHTFCLELSGVPDTPEWMCPLCEVDQLSADEDLYDDSEPEELQYILFDDTLNTTETDNELGDTVAAVRQPRVRQTARMRTSGAANRRAPSTHTRPRRRQTRRRRRAPARRRPTLMEQQRQRQRRQLRAHTDVHRRIENVNAITRDDSTSGGHSRSVTIRSDAPRLSIYDSEPIAIEDEPSTTTTSLSNRSVITPSEAARRIAASGIPILSHSTTEPSISRELSIRRMTPTLDRVPSRTIRPPSQPRIPINQLPRIQRRVNTPSRPRPQQQPPLTPPPVPMPITTRISNATSSTNSSFLDNLLNSQERLHNLENVRMHGPHIQIS